MKLQFSFQIVHTLTMTHQVGLLQFFSQSGQVRRVGRKFSFGEKFVNHYFSIKVKKSQQVDPRLSYLDEDFYGIAALVGSLASFHFGTEEEGGLKKHPVSKSSQP